MHALFPTGSAWWGNITQTFDHSLVTSTTVAVYEMVAVRHACDALVNFTLVYSNSVLAVDLRSSVHIDTSESTEWRWPTNILLWADRWGHVGLLHLHSLPFYLNCGLCFLFVLCLWRRLSHSKNWFTLLWSWFFKIPYLVSEKSLGSVPSLSKPPVAATLFLVTFFYW